MLNQQRHLQHLHLRAGFGQSPAFINSQMQMHRESVIRKLFSDSRAFHPINEIKDPTKFFGDSKKVGKLKLAALFAKSFGDLKKLNHTWLQQMATHKGQLREKMTLFWHDHFACQVKLGIANQWQNNLFRQYALGSFRDLLHAVAKDPAMLIFLNNQQNRKKAPNENFARELLELFTLGEGKYKERDIKEAARAFTGWSVNREGQFHFEEKKHDFGSKTFMGKTGNFEGEDIINIILENRDTATHICRKLYAFFVNEKVEEQRVKQLAKAFYNGNYQIIVPLKMIFMSDWFYDNENIGTRIKSPIELLAQYGQLLHLQQGQEKSFQIQKQLGQVLFQAPNVAGWNWGRSWIDSSTLPLRMQLPSMMFDAYDLRSSGIAREQRIAPALQRQAIKYRSKANWQQFANQFSAEQSSKLPRALAKTLLQSEQDKVDIALIEKYRTGNSLVDQVKSMSIGIMSLPEFQLC